MTYDMPREFYDETDTKDHPVLVVELDNATRMALVVTRTTKEWAQTSKSVAHDPDPDLGFNLKGWWRLHKTHKVPWILFNEPDVEPRGLLDDETWEQVQRVRLGKEDG